MTYTRDKHLTYNKSQKLSIFVTFFFVCVVSFKSNVQECIDAFYVCDGAEDDVDGDADHKNNS